MKDVETSRLRQLIIAHGGNMTTAAAELGFKPRTFRDEVARRDLADLVAGERSKTTLHVDAALQACRDHGSLRQAASWLGVGIATLHDLLLREGKLEEANHLTGQPIKQVQCDEPVGITKHPDGSVTIVQPTQQAPQLGDIGIMIRERGLDPDEWVVSSTGLNEWDALTKTEPGKPPRTVRLRQWKVTLQRAPHLVLAMPATYFPPVKRTPGPPPSEKPDVIVVQGDHQIPFMHEGLFAASMDMVQHLGRKHRLTDVVLLGDTSEFPTISRHADHPSTAEATPNACIQGTVIALQTVRASAPGARIRKLKGNHDWRVEAELLARAERMYGIRPGALAGEDQQREALSLVNLLRLEALDIELVEDPRGWQHAFVELVPGQAGLQVRHGNRTGKNPALAVMVSVGRSVIVGHTHKREHHFVWDASAGIERQAVTLGTMSLSRDERYPHFVSNDRWLQGFGVVTRWPDGRFEIEHARWNGSKLTWREHTFAAA